MNMDNELKIGKIILDVKAYEFSYEGYGVFRINKFPILIENLLKNEIADIKIESVNSKYALARVINRKTNSPERRNIIDIETYRAGNTPLEIMNYVSQINFKKMILTDLFKREIGWDKNINFIPSRNEFSYRNKITLQWVIENNDIKIGFFEKKTHKIVTFKKCVLINGKFNEFVRLFIQNLNDNKKQWLTYKNIFSVTFKYSEKYNEFLIIFNTTNSKNISLNLINKFQKNNLKIGIFQNIFNLDKVRLIKTIKIFGNDYLTYKIGKYKFFVGPNSFFQINEEQMLKIYNKIKVLLMIKGNESLFDVYSGISTIGIYLAHNLKEVISIEINKESVEFAKFSAKLNNVSNIRFIQKDATKYFTNLNSDSYVNNDNILVFDPPRSGLNKNVLHALKNIKVNKIIYLSCNPRTLVRDLKELIGLKYKVKFVEGYDMFPQTYHIETLVLLEK